MLAIQSHNTVSSSLTKYALLFGVMYLSLVFVLHKYFTTLLICYVVGYIFIFIKITSERRVTMLKIQAKRLDVYFSNFWKTEIKSFQLAELQGRYFNAKTLLKKPYSVLEITQDNTVVCAVETREGFEEGRLKTLFSLLNQIQ